VFVFKTRPRIGGVGTSLLRLGHVLHLFGVLLDKQHLLFFGGLAWHLRILLDQHRRIHIIGSRVVGLIWLGGGLSLGLHLGLEFGVTHAHSLLRGVSLHPLGPQGGAQLHVMALAQLVRLLAEGSKTLLLLQLGVVRLISNEGQVAIGVLGTELACSSARSVDNLGVIVVSLGLHLVPLLEDILGLLVASALDGVHHFGACLNLGALSSVWLNLLHVIVSGSHNRLFGIRRRNIVALVALR